MADLVLYDHRSSICSQMARLALVEKGLPFTRRQVDIMETNEQFEAWYVALNPRAVVPTLKEGDEVVTDTIRIVHHVDQLDAPDAPPGNLSKGEDVDGWLRDIMALHYGVLLYKERLEPDGTASQIVARGRYLRQMREQRPDLASLIDERIARNDRFQALLRTPEQIETHMAATRGLVQRMVEAVGTHTFLAGEQYTLADAFGTAALARFTIHGFADWWAGTALADYYARVKARPSFTRADVVDTGTERDL